MSRSAKVTLDWADGEYLFRLRIGELVELQEKCDAGPAHILERLATNRWKVQDIRETIRLGLIGGGLKPEKVLNLIKRYVDDRPFEENRLFAYAIVAASVVGTEDEKLGKLEGKEEKEEESSQTSPETKSDLPNSMPAEQ